jgi:hypothetical protein
MPHNTGQAVLDAAPLVTLGSYDLLGTAEQAIAFAAGELTLMSTKSGLSTTLVNSSHDFVGHAGLAERAGVGAGAAVLATGGSGATSAAARAVWPSVAAAAGVVILGVVGTWYFLHKRKNARVATEDNQSGVETVLAEAEAVVDAEFAHLRQTIPKP